MCESGASAECRFWGNARMGERDELAVGVLGGGRVRNGRQELRLGLHTPHRCRHHAKAKDLAVGLEARFGHGMSLSTDALPPVTLFLVQSLYACSTVGAMDPVG